jgi:hypothetical protein
MPTKPTQADEAAARERAAREQARRALQTSIDTRQ